MEYPCLASFLRGLRQNCLLLARHGETDWNARGLIQGQQDRPLSFIGYRQRKTLFFRLRSVSLARIFTSGLERAIQTALPLSEELGIPLEVLPALNEAKLGVFEGESKVDFDDELSARLYGEFLQDEVTVILPGGGENLRQVNDRIQEPLELIRGSLRGDGHVLVVSHRNVAKMLIKNLLDLSFEQAHRLEQKNHWLYIFAPRERQLFLTRLRDATGPLLVHPGYEEVEVEAAASSRPK